MFSATHEHAYGDTGGCHGKELLAHCLPRRAAKEVRETFCEAIANPARTMGGGEGTKGKWHLHPSPNAIDDESAPKSCVRIDEESSHWGIFPMG